MCGLECGSHAAGPDGSSRIRSKSEPRAWSTCRNTGFPDPVSVTVAPSLSFDLPTPQQSHSRERLRRRDWSLINPASRHQSPDDAGHLVGQRDPHQHRRLACYHAGHPRACRSPLAGCPPHNGTGADDQQAAKSRPRLKVSAGGASAARATAVTGPTPGMVISRRAVSFSLARWATAWSRPAIFASS